MKKVFAPPRALSDVTMHYCPGCTHGIIHRLIAEVIDEYGILERTIGLAPVGCAVFIYDYLECDWQQAAHGRAPAVATGIKRALPDRVVFTYQGDGDLASIGAAEIVHAANRGERLTVVYVNNAIYGMTGGQMAPTTLEGQVTATCPRGRDAHTTGYPMRMAEMLATLDGVAYMARTAVHDPANIARTRKALQAAFAAQLEDQGLGMVEILSTCPTNWALKPTAALAWLQENLIPHYPLGVIKDAREVS